MNNETNDTLFFTLLNNEQQAIEYAQELGLIPSGIECCGMMLFAEQRIKGKNRGFYFRCKKKIVETKFQLEKILFLKNLI